MHVQAFKLSTVRHQELLRQAQLEQVRADSSCTPPTYCTHVDTMPWTMGTCGIALIPSAYNPVPTET